jgi:hypothetical protein
VRVEAVRWGGSESVVVHDRKLFHGENEILLVFNLVHFWWKNFKFKALPIFEKHILLKVNLIEAGALLTFFNMLMDVKTILPVDKFRLV